MIDIKTTNFSKDYPIQERLYNDVITNIRNDLAKNLSDNYDEFAFSLLSQFRVTKDNLREWVGRIEIIETYFVRHFFIDGGYVFSIFTERDWSEFDDSHGYKIKIKYRVEVIKEMLGFTGPIR